MKQRYRKEKEPHTKRFYLALVLNARYTMAQETSIKLWRKRLLNAEDSSLEGRASL